MILHSRIYPFRPRDLRSYFIAKYYDIYTNDPLGIHQPKLDDIYWMSKVTSLCLNDVYLTQLPDLSNMICLRWASFDNNCLTKIQVKLFIQSEVTHQILTAFRGWILSSNWKNYQSKIIF